MHALATLGLMHPPRATQADNHMPAIASISALLELCINNHVNMEAESAR